MASIGLATGLISIWIVIHVAVPTLSRVPRDCVHTCLAISDPDFPRFVAAEGVSSSHGNHWYCLTLGLRRPRSRPCEECQVSVDAVNGILTRCVQEEGRHGKSLTLGDIGEFVPVHAENRKHSWLDQELRLNWILIRNSFGCQRQCRIARPSIDEHHQLRPPHHRQEACSFFVLDFCCGIHVLVFRKGKRHHGTRSAVDVKAKLRLNEGSKQSSNS
mmetsp:Transcript_66651/g.117847  ORF Transcript_66651/g.117847 Transcript_66651/m.117847 type:complete len:216 (-) Transcript_66651:623-1270(-)